jgi:hypothetical protein
MDAAARILAALGGLSALLLALGLTAMGLIWFRGPWLEPATLALLLVAGTAAILAAVLLKRARRLSFWCLALAVLSCAFPTVQQGTAGYLITVAGRSSSRASAWMDQLLVLLMSEPAALPLVLTGVAAVLVLVPRRRVRD